MSQQLTEAQSAQGRALRDRRANWNEVAAALHVSRSTAIQEAKRLGWWTPSVGQIADPERIAAITTEMRERGCSWKEIGAATGCTGANAYYRARQLGVAEVEKGDRAIDDLAREPLPAGACWPLICAGTCLDGTPYPAPLINSFLVPKA